ncbi:STAS/SEC14 domain-containing protein [Halovenus salina]|uniref:STAS/SEC14 domain-containing protein n=1 Tax=Halovenus salina TaxID=1510225 RepID=A0ABD5W7C3_9EURY|nr:STAS/SEC14 domain-containing protein [Halovenus salina]
MTEYAEGDKYREYMNTVIDAVEDTQCSNVLADTRDHPAIDQEDQEWSQKTWGPNAEAAGVDHVAVVAPESIVSKMSIESVTEGADDDIERQWFEEYEDAVSWLQSN